MLDNKQEHLHAFAIVREAMAWLDRRLPLAGRFPPGAMYRENRLPVRADAGIQPGSVFLPFHFREAAANVLTNDALDPIAGIPEYKVCAAQVGVEE